MGAINYLEFTRCEAHIAVNQMIFYRKLEDKNISTNLSMEFWLGKQIKSIFNFQKINTKNSFSKNRENVEIEVVLVKIIRTVPRLI